jgi:hypothetical protein
MTWVRKEEFLRQLDAEWAARPRSIGAEPTLRCDVFGSDSKESASGFPAVVAVEWSLNNIDAEHVCVKIERIWLARFTGDFDSVELEVGDEVKFERGAELERAIHVALAQRLNAEALSAEALH